MGQPGEVNPPHSRLYDERATPGEVNHLSTRRKRKQNVVGVPMSVSEWGASITCAFSNAVRRFEWRLVIPLVAASERGGAQTGKDFFPFRGCWEGFMAGFPATKRNPSSRRTLERDAREGESPVGERRVLLGTLFPSTSRSR